MSEASGVVLPSLTTRQDVQAYITGLAGEVGANLDDRQLATELDKRDQLAKFRSQFYIPKVGDVREKQGAGRHDLEQREREREVIELVKGWGR